MPSGKTHDRLTSLVSLALFPVAVAVSLSGQPITLEPIGTGLLNGAISSLCCAISGYYLSPDLDCMSHLKHRYRLFRWVWLPYYHLAHLWRHYRTNGRLTHRSYLSHSPIVGSASKLVYLSVPLLLVSGSAGVGVKEIAQYIQTHSGVVMAGAIGLEVGSLVHIVSDWIWSELH